MNAAAQHGRLAAYFDAEKNRLVRFVRRLIDDAADREAEDVVMDVLASLLNAADVSAPIEDLSAYVFRALRNRVTDLFRKRRLDAVSLDEPLPRSEGLFWADVLADPGPGADDEVCRAESMARIMDALDKLPPEQRAAVVETEFNGRAFRELSQEWGVPVGALLSRKSRALAKVRAMLGDEIE